MTIAGEGGDLPAGYLNLLVQDDADPPDYLQGVDNCRNTSDDLTPKIEQASSLVDTARLGEGPWTLKTSSNGVVWSSEIALKPRSCGKKVKDGRGAVASRLPVSAALIGAAKRDP